MFRNKLINHQEHAFAPVGGEEKYQIRKVKRKRRRREGGDHVSQEFER
jgi:hypothetical protein